jgi:uncharacterized protein YecE (DUF72 family)
MSYYIGTMGWSYDFWKGPLYPVGASSEEYLKYYSKHFNSVEVNNTFYRLPKTHVVNEWVKNTPKGFKFAVKAPRKITHSPNLEFDTNYLETFFLNIKHLGDKLGPILFQFPPQIKSDKTDIVESLLAMLPNEVLYAFEFRNKSWLSNDTLKILEKYNATMVQTNINYKNLKKVMARHCYIRWEGDRKKVNGDLGKVEIDRSKTSAKWAKKIKEYIKQEQEVYGYFSKYYSGYPPNDVTQLINLLSIN